MGSWTGKFDPLRRISDKITKKIGFDPSLASNVHKKIANAAHRSADNYMNQEPEGSENRAANKRKAEQQYLYGRGPQAEYDTPKAMRGAMRKRNLTIMGGS